MEIVPETVYWLDGLLRGFEGFPLLRWMESHSEVPVFIVTAYLALVFYIPGQMKDRPAMKIRLVFSLWNLCLALFSMGGAFYTVPVLFDALYNHGFYYTVCTDPADYFFDGPAGFWTAMFVLSKIPELADTVFLVVQKKPVIFLHWFHHCTVMLYCWHSYLHRISTGIWFATMNYSVHSVMYSYYFLMAIGARKLVKPIAPFITTMQIIQMVVGMFVTVMSFMWRSEVDPGECFIEAANARMGLVMYTSYFILFGRLFHKLYWVHKKATPSEEQFVQEMCQVETVENESALWTHTTKKRE